MAYAAVLSLNETLSRTVIFHFDYSTAREILGTAYDHALSLVKTLEYCSEGVTALDEEMIIEEARKLEDAIEFLVLTQSESGGRCCSPTFNQLRQGVDCFSKTAKEMQETIEELWEEKAAKMIEEYIEELFVQRPEEEEDVSSETDMVGLTDQFLEIIDKLELGYADQFFQITRRILNSRRVIGWISGMAGIGKSRLAKRIYDDPSVKANFECRAFVRVGQQFPLKEVLQSITAQLNLDCNKMIMEGDDDLYECFSMILSARRSLIVLDDVWEDTFLSPVIREGGIIDHRGSRILVTSRTNPESHIFWDLKMRFMNEEESWELLRRNVFGDLESCPPLLVKPGKKIAEYCEGLPLLIIAVAPILLSKAQKIPECWNRVAEKPHSVMEEASHQISEVLLSSYRQLNENFKLRFLYLAAFPLNYIVSRSSIINYWSTEGLFVGSWICKDFISFNLFLEKNLVVGRRKSWHENETKACSLHCAYWYLSRRVAENNKFLYTINSHANVLGQGVKSHRRLAIYKNVLLAIKEVLNKIASISTVRSLLCTGPYHQYQVPLCFEWRLLRVLDVLTIRFYEFPAEVVNLICLRYLALTCDANLPPSISKLWNLEFLIVHQHWSIKRVAVDQWSYVPMEIWDLQELIHLEIMGRNLPDPCPGAVLPNLVKLLDVGVQTCTKRVLESIPELEKLRIQIELAPHHHAAAQTLSCFDHLSCLHELESFKSVIMNPTLLHPPPPLAISLKYLGKLSLSGFGYPWEDMIKISQLRSLYVLKLQCYAFRGEKWDAKEIIFESLLKLSIEDTDLVQWTAGAGTFPKLFWLSMKNCHKLKEIPPLPFKQIKLVDCNPLVETCAKHENNTAEWVEAYYSWKEEKAKTL